MSEIWALIVGIIIVIVIYGFVSTKISERRKAKVRRETVPAVTDSLKVGVSYDVHLSDGKKFENVQIVGSIEYDDESFSFARYEGLLVLQKSDSKKVYLKKSSIRYVTEI